MKRFSKSLFFAINGLKLSYQLGRNFKIQLVLLLMSVYLGILFNISQQEWIWIIICAVSVLALETVNTAIEELCNKISLEQDERIKHIKDLSAGAVLIGSIGAMIVGIIIFSGHIFYFLF